MTDFKTVAYTVDGPIARIALNRPERRNALDHQLLDDIDAAFYEAERIGLVSLAVPADDLDATVDAIAAECAAIPAAGQRQQKDER